MSGRFALPRLEAPANLPPHDVDLSPIFTTTAIMRSLVLFNLLFAVQTVMDIKYLWGSAALPAGMTYAAYAHRGAYPLIVTALLAAGFVLAAMRPDSDAEYSPLIRALVFLWVGQNVLLVVSAIMRLNLYVEIYLLTYWRVAAFVWMAIVAVGLILVVARIVLYRSNAWLVGANLIVLTLTIYVCSFVNFANLVASYNVDHARSVGARQYRSDFNYLLSLGPQAIPALDRHFAADSTANLAYFRDYRGALARAARDGDRGLARLDVPRLAALALSGRGKTCGSLNTPLSLSLHSAPNRYIQSVSGVRTWSSGFSSSTTIRCSAVSFKACSRARATTSSSPKAATRRPRC